MNVATERTVRELVLEYPAAARILEKSGIDYCCGGRRSLEEACREAGVPLDRVLDLLAAAPPEQISRNWPAEPLAALIEHITGTHHKYTREELARLGPLFEKVCAAHGANHPELLRMRTVFGGLAQELAMHMMKEEMILFPYVARLEESAVHKRPAPMAPFGSVQNPVAMMMHEHDSAGDALRALREASAGYRVPPDACASYEALYRALAEFEADLHQHIHLENNILFPRAIEMEGAG